MAIAWLTVLKMVPWVDVISNAPKIADGALKLWSNVARRHTPDVNPGSNIQSAVSIEAQSIATLQKQLVAAEAKIVELHNQMLESTELIKALAEQSTLLIQRVEVNRIRVLWLAGVVCFLFIIVITTTLMR